MFGCSTPVAAREREQPYAIKDADCIKQEPLAASDEEAQTGPHTDQIVKVKEELVLDSEWRQPTPAPESVSAAWTELYADHVPKEEPSSTPVGPGEDHVVKEELVLGPKTMQRPHVTCVSHKHPNNPDCEVAGLTRPHLAAPLDSHALESSASHLDNGEKILESEKKDELNTLSEKKHGLDIYKQLKSNDEKFQEYFRLSREQFRVVLNLIEEDITKETTNIHTISPVQQLAVTLRYLATGENLQCLSLQHDIAHSHLPNILKTTLAAIREHLTPLYLPDITEEHLEKVARKFLSKWNLPNCCGALEGKRFLVQSSDACALILMAIVDADSKFMHVEVGRHDERDVVGLVAKWNIGMKIELGQLLPFPGDAKLPGSDICFPHFVIAGFGFTPVHRLMRLYGKRGINQDLLKLHYNKRLGTALNAVKGALGSLANVFRSHDTLFQLDVETVEHLILASCCLHNMLMEEPSFRLNSGIENSNDLLSLGGSSGGETGFIRSLRNQLKDYLCSPEGRECRRSAPESPGSRDKVSSERSVEPAAAREDAPRTRAPVKRKRPPIPDNCQMQDKSYPCEICGKQFLTWGYLRNHHRFHVGKTL